MSMPSGHLKYSWFFEMSHTIKFEIENCLLFRKQVWVFGHCHWLPLEGCEVLTVCFHWEVDVDWKMTWRGMCILQSHYLDGCCLQHSDLAWCLCWHCSGSLCQRPGRSERWLQSWQRGWKHYQPLVNLWFSFQTNNMPSELFKCWPKRSKIMSHDLYSG